MKKNIKLVTALSLLITLVFANDVYADNKIYTNGNFKFILNDDETITIIEYFGIEDTAEIPMLIGGYPVVSISEETFKDIEIKEIKVPETIPVEEVQSAVGEKTQIDTFNRDNEIINTIMPKQESETPTTPIPLEEHEIINNNANKKEEENNEVINDNQEIIDDEITIDENDTNIDDNEFIEEIDVEDETDVGEENNEEIVHEQTSVKTSQEIESRSNTPILITSTILIIVIVIYIIFRKRK